MEHKAVNRITVEIPATHYTDACLPGVPNYKDMICRRLGGTLVTKGQAFQLSVGGRSFTITVIDIVGETSRLERLHTDLILKFAREARCNSAEDEATADLLNMIQSSFESFDAFQTLQIPVAKSILIHGVAGVGKTTLIRRVCEILHCVYFDISIHDLLALSEEVENPNFSEYNPLHLVMNKALVTSPSIVAIRDLNSLGISDTTSAKVLDVIEKEINRIAASDQVCVIGLAKQLRSLPEVLRKTSVFRQHMTLPIPTLLQRRTILSSLLKELNISSEGLLESFSTKLSLRTSGYVARDLRMICRNAVFKSMRRKNDLADRLAGMSLTKESPASTLEWPDFEYALAIYKPSQQIEIESTAPTRSWDDIGGYEEIKKRMKQTALMPLLHPESFTRLGVTPPSGLLLYGPSGCGKTAFVQALVSESTVNVISIRGPEIFSKYLGETESMLRKLFATAKRIAPCIIFMDEMDAIGAKRGWNSGDSGNGVNERVLSTLLNEMDGVEGRKGVFVIGCTNRPGHIDDALLRPGRLDQLVYVGLPKLQDRLEMIQIFAHKMAGDTHLNAETLAHDTEYCTGADLENIFREAGTAALKENVHADTVSYRHLKDAAEKVALRAKQLHQDGVALDIYDKFRQSHSL